MTQCGPNGAVDTPQGYHTGDAESEKYWSRKPSLLPPNTPEWIGIAQKLKNQRLDDIFHSGFHGSTFAADVKRKLWSCQGMGQELQELTDSQRRWRRGALRGGVGF